MFRGSAGSAGGAVFSLRARSPGVGANERAADVSRRRVRESGSWFGGATTRESYNRDAISSMDRTARWRRRILGAGSPAC